MRPPRDGVVHRGVYKSSSVRHARGGGEELVPKSTSLNHFPYIRGLDPVPWNIFERAYEKL